MIFGMVGCGDSHEKAAEELLKAMEDLTVVLETIEDEDSAKAAVPELELLTARLESLSERIKTLGNPEDNLKRQLESEYGERFKTARESYLNEMMRIIMLGELVSDPVVEAMEQFKGVDTAPLGG